ncbi:MAG: GTPase [Parvibaculum sp.]
MNRLARREAAIVSEEAGTTRDVLEVRLDIGGVPVTLADTAGLREAAGAIEREGVRRALERAERADLRLVVAAPDAGGFDLAREGDIRLLNKIDLGAEVPAGIIGVSAMTGAGLDALEAALSERVGLAYGASEHPLITRARHREGLTECAAALARAGQDGDADLVAEDLRLAARALGRLTGRVDVEELLDVIFRDFCIGK